jgi:hypothetical protein
MANKCAQLLDTLNDQQPRLEGSGLFQATVDEVTACVALVPLVTPLIIEKNTLLSALEKIRKRAKQWAQYNLIKSFGELPVVVEY